MFRYSRNLKSVVIVLIFISTSWLSGCSSDLASSSQIKAPTPIQATPLPESATEESVVSPIEEPAVTTPTEPISQPNPTSNPPENQEPAQSGTEEGPTNQEETLLATSASSLAFTTLSQGASMIIQLDKPAIFIAGKQDEIGPLQTWLTDPEITQSIETVDLNSNWVVGVFQGPVGSSGYGIDIQSVNQVANEITLTANLTEPGPDQMTSDVISYPYQIIILPKSELTVAPDTIWSVYTDNGELLAQESYP